MAFAVLSVNFLLGRSSSDRAGSGGSLQQFSSSLGALIGSGFPIFQVACLAGFLQGHSPVQQQFCIGKIVGAGFQFGSLVKSIDGFLVGAVAQQGLAVVEKGALPPLIIAVS